MKSNYEITLFNCQNDDFHMSVREFITFEEAVIFANHTRNKLGHHWSTVSIIKERKSLTENVNSIKKIEHSK